ncbi:hypothetical protein OU994_19760 [Pseudoduganella sp. SL102]|uniref:hypothetical protein n=1 Tax=Pseudoduganella sp. SL102 TaxID=2995154 RepID=UPI00248B5137|nr:hypothetical protein [Pseudoduganella sp. SL102]WBS00545.1 hypothetical protein OU994_19760 [Pseudoduganella sp. SL102]
MKRVSILIAATIGAILFTGIGFVTGAITAGTRGWFTPVVRVVVENQSGEDITNVVLTHRAGGQASTVQLPALENGQSAELRYYAGNAGGYEISATLADGRTLKGGSGYAEGGNSTREVITASKITGSPGSL